MYLIRWIECVIFIHIHFGPEFATEGPAGVYFTKPKKPIPPNSQQQRFWSEMEAGKDDLAKKLDEGTG
ncbi:hypothetical protein, partial [Paenibacillus hubeiensis]|uniref:hypothetical protein n=1 Tax=Paenibacillus hubeiensis TaxID=3077330 RepID=UPI0031BA6BD9